MKVLSVTTLVSPAGEYGGPLRVATNQATALARAGHEVVLAAGTRGFAGPPPQVVDDVPAALFPARRLVPRTGFAGLAAPGLQRALPVLSRSADVMHVHAARDLVTLPAAAWALRHGVPYVLQTHGMIDPSARALARPLDLLLTRRVLAGARAVMYLTELERENLERVGGPGLRLAHVPNGVPLTDVVAAPSSREVLYLARLAPRKRPRAFVEMAAALAARHPDASFRLVGPDEGEGTAVNSGIEMLGPAVDVSWEGPLAPERTQQRMSSAQVYVLPSVDEPYPMSVLEAMSIGLPVVVTDTCGLAPLIRRWDAGRVVDSRLSSLVDAVDQLLADPDGARAAGVRGREAVREHLSMASVVRLLEQLYA